MQNSLMKRFDDLTASLLDRLATLLTGSLTPLFTRITDQRGERDKASQERL